MTVDGAAAAGMIAPAAQSASTSTTGQTQDDQQMFLQLLVAQLKYQDPMNPADSSQLVGQEAQMTEVQSIQTMTGEISQMLSASMAFGATGMIGKQVSYADANGNQVTGTVTSVAFGAGGPTLAVGGQAVPLTSVLAVNADSPPDDTSDPTT